MTLLESYTLATDATFQHQVQVAALQYALVVVGEAPTAHSQVDAKRHALALSVLADGGFASLQQFTYGIASVPGFSAVASDQSGANDAAINSAIVSNWDHLAGVTAQDLANG